MEMGDDGIARVRWAPQSQITLTEAHNSDAALVKLQGGKACPLLVDITNVVTLEREARNYYAKTPTVTAIALVGSSILAIMLANFFIKISSPTRPTRLFRTETQALEWLGTFVK